MRAYDPKCEELHHVAGDMDTGVTTDYHLTKSALGHPQIRYKGRHGDFVLTADVYKMPSISGGSELMVHLLCPRCRHAVSIKSSQKVIEFEQATSTLSVEAFQCPWELSDTDGREGERLDFGIGLCRFTAAIDRNRMVDA